MCGIIAIARQRSNRVPPSSNGIKESADLQNLGAIQTHEDISNCISQLLIVKNEISGSAGMNTLINDPEFRVYLQGICSALTKNIANFESDLVQLGTDSKRMEEINTDLVALKDLIWHIEYDRVSVSFSVEELLAGRKGDRLIEVLLTIQQVLSGLDRLEVRGRDSAGVHIMIQNHGLDLHNPGIRQEIEMRTKDLNYKSGSVRVLDNALSIVYKVASEIGELGDNTRELRKLILSDDLFYNALESEDVTAVVIGHSRWASVGIISEPNTHPMNSEQLKSTFAPFVVAAANGDVDNFADLKRAHDLEIPKLITSDSKVIPALIANEFIREQEPISDLHEAFRKTMLSLEGSIAVIANADLEPHRVYVALRGSGQGLYVGLSDEAYVVASEPYGLVETTDNYLRLNGETLKSRQGVVAGPGEIVTLSLDKPVSLESLERIAYDGTPLPVESHELTKAEITTRDIDRRNFPHFLLKEIYEAPESFKKTLRGNLSEQNGRYRVVHSDSEFPTAIRERLEERSIEKIYIIGQGTAAVAGQALGQYLTEEAEIPAEAIPSTELSGFRLSTDMSNALVIAISQSGTTTDTNRTVDLVRGRGASVIAIVNRRNSDLSQKADGVIYTSDGRDIEMSVASTKAFYSQIAASFLLGISICDQVKGEPENREHLNTRQILLKELNELPNKMLSVLEQQDHIRDVAFELAPSKRYWALAGNGLNIVAAREIRIKLSELCYKSIAADYTEDKKHIDLSAEPMILICATGLNDSMESDVTKEVAIYKAHKASPIVITDNSGAYPDAHRVISVPKTNPKLSFILATMVGHLFGYEAALSIDALALPFRQTRSLIEKTLSNNPLITAQELLESIGQPLEPITNFFFNGLRSGSYNGSLEANTATRISNLYRYALGTIPLDSYQIDTGKVGTPATLLEDLNAALTIGIEELTRPIDAIKHQAKTVTVGISRSDEELIQLQLVTHMLDSGTPRDRISYRNLRFLAALDPAVKSISGFIRYEIEGDVKSGNAQLHVIDKGGIAHDLTSRTERDPKLKGSKHLVALQQEVIITNGRHDQRIIVLVPEIKDKQTIGLTLLHIELEDYLTEQTARHVMEGYKDRYMAVSDYVTETEPTFRSDILASIPVDELLISPVEDLLSYWNQ
jgi:glucosamine--fructose-6-phosphate aminotransferase (isomerizing)